ncbi:MAG TPA: DUF72 domain-containing protein [Gracilimonas sp.]|uniref:DUF72 domain-containing protein n=1 Tax=Gracilimonas sp. TaxID=1974203 RepID=UPI002D96888C|nr:DUF72 domain-containing protein [Gracilimonas sp.]
MKFGSVENPEAIDFTLPEDHPDTLKVLNQKGGGELEAYVGCAKWNKSDLKGFYPRGIKDELTYYSRQFNSIELNATHYRMYGPDQAQAWIEKTPGDFKFFPKINNSISHYKRLKSIEAPLEEYLHGMRGFGDQLEMIFLQLRDDFKPKDFDRVQHFVEIWPNDIPLAIELRHTDWFNDATVADQVYRLFEKHNVANVITDTAGRRDLLHMRLTSPVAFIRYVGANHESDYTRLDDWVERLKFWKDQGMEKLYFFVHQNMEKESPMLSAHFIKKINQELDTDLGIPGEGEQGDLGL